jgi:Pvc16 N-terminal domain
LKSDVFTCPAKAGKKGTTMATSDAIRDTSESLIQILRANISATLVPPSRIVAATPDEFADLRDPLSPAITVFLYRVSIAADLRNVTPKPRRDGRVRRPLLPLELRFLITPWSDDDTRTELSLVGQIAQTLHDHEELAQPELRGDAWEEGDCVSVTMESLPLEDHYRIWDAVPDVPYRLSLTYVARVVGIESRRISAHPPIVDARFGRSS